MSIEQKRLAEEEQRMIMEAKMMESQMSKFCVQQSIQS